MKEEARRSQRNLFTQKEEENNSGQVYGSTMMEGASICRIDGGSFNGFGGSYNRFEQHYNHCTIGTDHGRSKNTPSHNGGRDDESVVRTIWNKIKSWTPFQTLPKSDDGLRRAKELIPTIIEVPFTNLSASHVNASGNSACKLCPPHANMSIPETYSHLMSETERGCALYHPQLEVFNQMEYRKNGIQVGDVGTITRGGNFDVLFNVRAPQHGNVNPSELPDELELLNGVDISSSPFFPPDTHLLSTGVNQICDSPPTFKCSGLYGAVLELPEGAISFKARNTLAFRDLAERHAGNWYKFMAGNKAIDAHNGALYIVTRCIKCTDWGIAFFDRSSAPEEYLQFVVADTSSSYGQTSRPRFDWRRSGSVLTKVSPSRKSVTVNHEEPNQCIFFSGYQIILPKETWASIMDRKSRRNW